ncbi:hypothetical protein HYY75_06435 [bacterium]|nr:hypothetical protein [bacterium]
MKKELEQDFARNKQTGDNAFLNGRSGFAKLILIFAGAVLIIFSAIFGIIIYQGQQAEVGFEKLLKNGMASIEKEQAELAIDAFQKAGSSFCFSQRFFRLISGSSQTQFHSPIEVDQLAISAILMRAYQELFQMKTGAAWVKKAQEKIANLPKSEFSELHQNLATARELSNLCELFQAKKYREVLKGLRAAENNALTNDADFFLMEVRILIACGKAINEPAFLEKAQELLWFLSKDVGIKNPRIDFLWNLLSH